MAAGTAAADQAAATALRGPTSQPASIAQLPANTWVKAAIDFKAALPAELKDATYETSDGYSDNLWRAKTGTLIIRSGIASASAGYSPGFYSNTSIQWDPATNKAQVVEIANWGGGSYGGGKLLDAYKDRPTPTPRHTYDCMAYVPQEDAMYLMLGANWRLGTNATTQAAAELKADGQRTWRYSFANGAWTSIEDNVWKHFSCSPYEAHMRYWPDGGKLIFLNDDASKYAEFDLKERQWATADLKNKCPMGTLYTARSTWDSKRALWVFRLGPKVCTFDPARREFAPLPPCWEIAPPDKDVKNAVPDLRLGCKGICYISRHDAYLVTGPTGNDTMVYHAAEGKWESVQAGDIKLVNGYCQYSPELDLVLMNYQLECFQCRYALPDTASGAKVENRK